MLKLEETSEYKPATNPRDEIEKFFGEMKPSDCDKIAIQNNVVTIKSMDMGKENEYEPGF